MTADVIGRAFEPFYTTKVDGTGTGLGLATVYGIVTQAGGNITIYSEPGLGTTIRVFLPGTGEEPAGASAAAKVAWSRGGETILLVEDEDIVREPTRRMLARYGYEVLTAASADEAVRVAEGRLGDIDLLLTDVVMPGRSGRDLAAELLARGARCAVVFMSGYSQDVIVHRGVLDEGVTLVEKPFSSDALLGVVRAALDGA
jgi:hypothetical protein